MKTLKFASFILVLLLLACTNKVEQGTSDVSVESIDKSSVAAPENQVLYDLIKEKDSLLFQVGFNQIDTSQVASLTASDFEFYHDQHGVTDTKSAFIESINSIGELPFKTWRTLVEGSMEVFPLHKDNSQGLYGAIQHGDHDFYQQIEGENARKTNTARFTHLWIIEAGEWKLKRVLSYDHQVPE
ncbi:MAG: hypothetical protein ACI9XB_005231 [Gammaproteobacteria bacterium]|jgi:hypothetical protein